MGQGEGGNHLLCVCIFGHSEYLIEECGIYRRHFHQKMGGNTTQHPPKKRCIECPLLKTKSNTHATENLPFFCPIAWGKGSFGPPRTTDLKFSLRVWQFGRQAHARAHTHTGHSGVHASLISAPMEPSLVAF